MSHYIALAVRLKGIFLDVKDVDFWFCPLDVALTESVLFLRYEMWIFGSVT